MYHRVADLTIDPWGLAVTPHHFAEQLSVLQKHCDVMPLDEMTQRLARGEDLHHTAAITFDDGYADNAQNAAPALEEAGLPATFFIVAGYIGSGGEFWWDELERLLLHPGTLPRSLTLTIDGQPHTYATGDAAHYSEDAFQQHRAWRAVTRPSGPRQALFLALWKHLRTQPAVKRAHLLRQIRVWADAAPDTRPCYRTLTHAELSTLAAQDGVEIGAHTMTHPDLPTLAPEAQHLEIRQSKRTLEAVLEQPVHSFSYPYGRHNDRTVAIARAVGLDCACTTTDGRALPKTHPFRLPRLTVPNLDGAAFDCWLRGWLYD